jgi:hypothetical protein
MKKMLIAVLCMGCILAACEDETGDGTGNGTVSKNSNLRVVNGSNYTISNVSWKSNSIKYDGRLTLPSIYDDGYYAASAYVQDGSDYLYFTREGSTVMKLRTRDAITVSGDTTFTLTDSTIVAEVGNESNTGALSTIKPSASAVNTGLSIKNQSFTDLLNVQWQGVTFASNTLEDAIPAGNNAQKAAPEGTAYIYFKRKSNPAFARTKEPVTVTNGEIAVFTFTDNTLIVEANNPDNTGTLKDMKTTVVFFDDAEGEIQNYAERKNSSYYAEEEDLPNYDSYYSSYYHQPYKGTGKSIAVGGNDDCKLRLSITLERKGKISFRFAHEYYRDTEDIGAISIDGTEKASWSGNYDWSYLEYTLEAGSHEIVWTKDGYYSTSSYRYRSYLSLDDILVVYTE